VGNAGGGGRIKRLSMSDQRYGGLKKGEERKTAGKKPQTRKMFRILQGRKKIRKEGGFFQQRRGTVQYLRRRLN